MAADKCVVCLEELGSTNELQAVRLGCGHELCAGCLSKLEGESAWLGLSQSCPLCRAPLPRVAAAEKRGLELARRALRRGGGRELLLSAVVALRSVVDATKGEGCARAAYALGACLAKLGAVQVAAAAFRQAGSEEAQLALALMEGKASGLQSVYRSCRAPRCRFEAAMALSKLVQSQHTARLATAYAGKALEDAPDRQSKCRAFVRLGEAAESLGDLESARKLYSASLCSDTEPIESDGTDYESSEDEEVTETTEQDSDEDEIFIRATDFATHDHATGSLKLGLEAWRRLGSTPSVRGWLRLAARTATNDTIRVRASLYLGLAQLDNSKSNQQNAPRRAARSLRRAAAQGPARALALTKLGAAYIALGDLGRAERALRSALQVEPTRIGSLLRLADTLDALGAQHGGPWRMVEATQLRRKAFAHMSRRGIVTLVIANGETFGVPAPAANDSHAWLPTSQANLHNRDDYHDDDEDYDDSQAPTSICDDESTVGPRTKETGLSSRKLRRHVSAQEGQKVHFTREDRAILAASLRSKSATAMVALLSTYDLQRRTCNE